MTAYVLIALLENKDNSKVKAFVSVTESHVYCKIMI